MAISNFLQEVWSARLIMELEAESVYQGLANRNWEADARDSRKVHIGTMTKDITVSNYSVNTDISAPEVMDDSIQTLTLDQQKYFNFYVDDIDQVQSKPNIMSEAMRKAAIAIAQVKDTYCSTTILNAGVKANNRQTYTPGATLTTTAQLKSAGEKLLNAYTDLRETIDKANVSSSTRVWSVLGPRAWRFLNYYFRENASSAFMPAVNESTLRSGFKGQLYGIDLIQSNRLPQKSSKDVILVGTSDAWTYADQIMEMESYRPEKRFGDAVKGLYVYAGKVVQDEQLWTIDET